MDTAQNIPLLYIDILGFSEVILSKTIEESIKYFQQIHSDFDMVTSRNVGDYKINFDIVSDTAFLWIEGKDPKTCTIKIFEIAAILVHNSFYHNRPIRGAIVWDEFMIGNIEYKSRKKPTNKLKSHLILGKAIINAYRWEKAQEWFGVSINPFYLKKFKWILSELMSKNILIPYTIPTKFGEIESYAVNPFRRSNALGEPQFEAKPPFIATTYDQLISELMDTSKDFSVLHKYTNTKKFLQYITDTNLLRT